MTLLSKSAKMLTMLTLFGVSCKDINQDTNNDLNQDKNLLSTKAAKPNTIAGIVASSFSEFKNAQQNALSGSKKGGKIAYSISTIQGVQFIGGVGIAVGNDSDNTGTLIPAEVETAKLVLSDKYYVDVEKQGDHYVAEILTNDPKDPNLQFSMTGNNKDVCDKEEGKTLKDVIQATGHAFNEIKLRNRLIPGGKVL